MTRSGPRFLRCPAAILLIAVFLHGTLQAQLPTYRWSVYSTLDNVRAVTFDLHGGLWVAANGGAAHARVNGGEDSVVVFRTSDGLMSLNSTAIALDSATGDIAVGSQGGAISILHTNGRWSYSGEIASETERAVRTITGLQYHGGRLYVLTAFGVGVYNPRDSIFLDSWLRFGSIPRNTRVTGLAFHADSVWVATDSGLVAASMRGNLANPEVWSVRIGGAITSMAVRGDSLYVADTEGVVALSSDGAAVVHAELAGAGILLAAEGDKLVAASGGEIFVWGGGGFNRIAGAPARVTAIAVDGAGGIGVGVENSGFGRVEGDAVRLVSVNSPVGNTFSDLALASDGALWASSAERLSTPGNGVSRLKNGAWTRFTVATVPELKSSQVWNIGADSAGRIWAGTYGASVTVFSPDAGGGYTAVQYDPTNSSIQGVGGPGSNFAIIGKSVADRNGRTWFTNWNPQAFATPVLHVKLAAGESSPDGTGFLGFGVRSPGPFRWLAIDEAGTKWLGADDADGHPGMFWYNDRGTLLDRSDDRSGMITQSEGGLLNNQQNAIVVDHLGEVWVGTPTGISVLVNPTSVALDGATPIFRTVTAMADVYVTALAVDALDRKWVGSSRGLYLLNADGSQVLASYTMLNSPLVDNDVRSILTVDATGDVYIGTANGLNRIETEAVVQETPSGRLVVSPQPFLLPSVDPLRIDGLPSNSIIKVLAPSGTLIREIVSPGGAVAYWDGRDNRGDEVPTGVYIIAAGAADGSDAALGKVAVIRRK